MKITGKNIMLLISRAGEMIPVCCGREFDINISSEAIEATKLPASDWRSFIYGIKEFSISCSGLMVIDESFIMKDFFNAMNNRETVAFVGMANNGADVFFSGNVVLTSLNISAPYKDMATYSVTGQGDGELNMTNPYKFEIMTDENNNPITDENGNLIYSQNSGDLLPINVDINC